MLQSLSARSLVRSDNQRHVFAADGLRYLARRDRSAVGIALGRWKARKRCRSGGSAPVMAGTSLRSLDSQLDLQDAINTAAALSAEVARSKDHLLLELLPTCRSSIGYRYQGADYVIHPGATFWLSYRGDWRPYFLEFERRAITPKRVRARLKNYPRYFASGWADLDPPGNSPWCCSCSRATTPRSPSSGRQGRTGCPSAPPTWK